MQCDVYLTLGLGGKIWRMNETVRKQKKCRHLPAQLVRMWSLTTDKTALSAHLVLARGDTEQEAVLQRATRALRSPDIIYTRISMMDIGWIS